MIVIQHKPKTQMSTKHKHDVIITNTHRRESLKLLEVEEAEELHGDGRRDDQQAHGEDDQAAQLFPRAEDLEHEVLQQR